MTKPQITNATAAKILKAAQETFLEKGFEGASINDIADRASINKSLIYHHYGSKEDLWKSVKAHMIQDFEGKSLEEMEFPTGSFKSFLQAFVTFRFEFYNHNPAITRLIAWQRLEKNKEDISGVGQPGLSDIAPQIKIFQEKGEIRPDLDPEMVSYLIMTSASMPFMDPPAFLQGKTAAKQKQQYLNMLIDGLYAALATHKLPQKWIVQ